MLIVALVGLLAGTHASIWGMYKDAIHEGFMRTTFARSMIVGTLCALVIQWYLQLPIHQPGTLVLLFGLAYAAERGVVEVWKTFIRDEDQSKYFIPMQFSLYGRPVRSRLARLALGVVYVAGVSLVLFLISRLDGVAEPTRFRMAMVGLATGMIVAISGAWKDAPKEGFETLKFFRSPAMTVTYAILLSYFTDSYLLAAAGALGFERATAETYKTFFFPSKPRGKFTGKPVLHPEMLTRRYYFVPVYVSIWILVVTCAAMALVSPTATLFAAAGP